MKTASRLTAKVWAHPREGLSLDEAAEQMRAVGNTVLALHRDCGCEGATNAEGRPAPNDHLLLAVAHGGTFD